MVFLCGRPGCGRESSATLQIDAPSSTISLVDPRVSRDGVPLCPHHADATTPPLGWTMNDLRSRNRTLAPVPSLGPRTGEIVSTPPKSRPPGNPLFQSSRPAVDEPEPDDGTTDDEQSPLTFKVSRDLRSMPVTAASPDDERHRFAGEELRAVGPRGTVPDPEDSDDGRAPASRPSKRREVDDEAVGTEDKFPWHHHFTDEEPEPEELQAKSPLLSRAFRSSVG